MSQRRHCSECDIDQRKALSDERRLADAESGLVQGRIL